MIKQIVDSIVEAESEAEKQVALAQERSRQTVFNAQNEAENSLAIAHAEQKEIAKQLQFASFVVAEKKAKELIESGNAGSEKFTQNFLANMPKAVDFVVGRMIDKCQ